VVNQLHELQRRATDYASRDGRVAADDFFFAEQNARLVKDAEQYYREMFRGRESSWNLRDRHMADTLEHLIAFLAPAGTAAEGRYLGTQLSYRRRPRHCDDRPRRSQRRTACARALQE
jgi:hypothetical protein